MSTRDILLGATENFKFRSRQLGTGLGFTLVSGTVAAYPSNSTTEITAGITLTTNFDTITGLNNVTVVATAANGYAAGVEYALVLIAGTVDGVAVGGEIVGRFTIQKSNPLVVLGLRNAGLILSTGIISAVGGPGQITLPAAQRSPDNDAYQRAACVIIDSADPNQISVREVTAYNGTSGVLTLESAFGFTPNTTDTYVILSSTVGGLRPTTVARLLDVSTGGEAGVDWANIGSPTTAQNLSATNIATNQVVASVTGAVASVTNPVTVGTNNDKTGYGLSATAVNDIWDELTAETRVAGSFGQLLKDNLNGAISAVLARLPAALVGGRMDSFVGAMGTDTLTDTSLAASAVTEIQTGLGTSGNQTTILNRIGPFTGTGINDILGFFRALLRNDASAPSDIGGTYAPATHSLQANFTEHINTQNALVPIQSDTDDIQTRLPATLNGGRMRSHVEAMDAAVITATVIATDAIGSDELAASAVTEIQTGLGTLANQTDIQSRLPATLSGGRMRSDMEAISADSVAADNLEAMFDGTGYTNDFAPSTQQQVNALAAGSSAVNVGAGSFVLTTGNEDAGSITNTLGDDGTYHQFSDTAGTFDMYYQFTVGSNGIPVSGFFNGRVNGINDSLNVYAWNWSLSQWEQVAFIQGVSGTTDSNISWTMFPRFVGTGANLNLVRIRWQNTGLTTMTFFIDQVYISYVVVPLSPIRQGLVAGAGTNYIDLDAGASAINNYYFPALVRIISGPGEGQSRRVSSYDGTLKRLFVATNWSTTPTTSSEFAILEWATVRVSEMDDNTITSAVVASNTIDADALAADAIQKMFTSQLTEAYAADGAQPTLAQILYMIQQVLNEVVVSGTSMTVRQLDGTTVAATFTLNDATNPTSITRTG